MPYGPGTFLLFKFLKQLTWIFAVMGILSVVSLVLLAQGTYYQDTLRTHLAMQPKPTPLQSLWP